MIEGEGGPRGGEEDGPDVWQVEEALAKECERASVIGGGRGDEGTEGRAGRVEDRFIFIGNRLVEGDPGRLGGEVLIASGGSRCSSCWV